MDLDKIIAEAEKKLKRLGTIKKLVEELRQDIAKPALSAVPDEAFKAKPTARVLTVSQRYGKSKRNGLLTLQGKKYKRHYQHVRITCRGCGKGMLVVKKKNQGKGHTLCMARLRKPKYNALRKAAAAAAAKQAVRGAVLIPGDPLRAGQLGHE